MTTERTYLTVLESLDRDLAKLKGRDDPAAAFAREHLSDWRAGLRNQLNGCRKSRPKYAAACRDAEAAQKALDEKRAELMAAVERELEPLIKAASAAEPARKEWSKSATLGEHRVPLSYVLAAGTDPGSTKMLANHPVKGMQFGITRTDLARAMHKKSAAEMVAAIAAEADYPDDQFPAAPEAFELRWQHWAHANGVNAGPPAPPANADADATTPGDYFDPKHAATIVAQQRKNYPNQTTHLTPGGSPIGVDGAQLREFIPPGSIVG